MHLITQIISWKYCKATSFAKLIKYENYEFTLFKDGRMNAYGVHSDEEASGLYHTLIKSIR